MKGLPPPVGADAVTAVREWFVLRIIVHRNGPYLIITNKFLAKDN